MFTPDDDTPGCRPVAVLSHHAWQTTYGGDTTVVGSTFIMSKAIPFTVVGVAPPGFFGETLRSDPPDIWIPLQQEPLISGGSSLLRQSVSAWLRVIGRLRPGAPPTACAPRLTGVLRQWMQNDSGYPANWMPDVIRMLPQADHQRRSRRRRRRRDEGRIRAQPADPARRLRPGAADRLRQRREPVAGARRGAAYSNGAAAGRRRDTPRRS